MNSKIKRFKHSVICVWPSCWLSLIDNVVGIITFGYYVPNLSMKYCFWISLLMLDKKIKNGKK